MRRRKPRWWPCIAVVADQLSEAVATRDALTAFCDLSRDVLDCVRVVARSTKVVLLIDQLDALSELMDLKTDRLTLLLRLINDMKYTQNVHVVCSCRTFERQYDRRLNTIQAEDMVLALPSWDAAAAILAQHGVAAGTWPESFQEMLRVPQYLKLFLRHLVAQGRPRSSRRIRRCSNTCGANRDRPEVEYLVSTGILQYDASRRLISFTHQTLFDLTHARAFVADGQSLARYALARQTGLFVRPKLWSALHYLRGANAEIYKHELQTIWQAEQLRPHLRMLLIDFVGQHPAAMAYISRWHCSPDTLGEVIMKHGTVAMALIAFGLLAFGVPPAVGGR